MQYMKQDGNTGNVYTINAHTKEDWKDIRLSDINLSVRALNCLRQKGLTTLAELASLSDAELLKIPNFGKRTLREVRELLSSTKDELTNIPASGAQDGLDRMQTSVGTFEYIEDELCAAVKMSVRTDAYAIVIRRTGWDGNRVWTLQELADDPNASGRASPITRERIRQIESRGLTAIPKKRLSMPLLGRTISLIEENAPLAASTLPGLLKRYKLTRCGLGFKEINKAMEIFQVQWNLVCRDIGQELFLFPHDEVDEIEFVWATLVKEAFCQDFVQLDEIACLNQNSNRCFSDIVISGISRIPTLEWLDRNQRIYWGSDRVNCGWNKIINVCRKILTVAPCLPFKRLMTAVKRARTVRNCPSRDILKAMVCAFDEIDVVDEMVSRGANFKPDILSQNDRLMIDVAKNVGTVTTFLKLREALVRKGLATNYAQVQMVVSPLWITTSRGKYRFIANEAQLNKLSLAPSIELEEFQKSRECLVEFVSAHKHLVAGTHRISGNSVKQGEWSLKDEWGNNLGKINVAGCVIKGLDRIFAEALIEVGTAITIDFSDKEFMATLFHSHP